MIAMHGQVHDRSRWLGDVATWPRPTMRLFCFPYAGGGTATYRPWARLLPGMQVCPVRLPGREMRIRDSLIADADQLVSHAVEALLPYLDSPFALFGHSLGALTAFEINCRLLADGLPLPTALMVSGRPPPNHIRDNDLRARLPGMTDSDILEYFCNLNELTRHLLEDRMLREVVMPVLRSDLRVMASMPRRPPVKLPARIVAFGGTQDPSSGLDDVRDWQDYALNGFSFHAIEGDHMFVDTNGEEVCRRINQELAA